MKKRVLSVFMTVLLIINCLPLSATAEFDEDSVLIEVLLETNFAEKITVSDKVYDGELNATVDCSSVKIINANTLEEITEYSIWLEAEGKFETPNASDNPKKVSVSGFQLGGDDKNKFKLIGEYNEVVKYASINHIEVVLNRNFADYIYVADKEYDGNRIAEIDCKNVLDFNSNQYDVYLVADGVFENENASNVPKKVIVNNFRLEGTDKDNFKLMGEYGEVEKYASINPKELIITPDSDKASIYYGQQLPEFTYTIEPANVYNIDIVVSVDYYNEILPIGRYNYIVESNNPNYSARIADDCVFTVKEFSTEERAVINDESEIYHDNKVKLEAPNGFLISSDGINFYSDITVNLEKTSGEEKKAFSYYLRYNVNDTTGYYGAISQEISYDYLCELDEKEPEIIYINIRNTENTTETESLESDAPMKIFSFGNYTNNEIEIIVRTKDLASESYISGINSVTLYDYDETTNSRIFIGEFDKEKQIIDDEEICECVLKITPNKNDNPNNIIKNMFICVTDNKGNEYSKRVVDEIKLYFENNSDNLPDEYLRIMESNSLVVESVPPEVIFDTSNSSAVEENIYWYNAEGGVFTINVNDDEHGNGMCSGIHSIKITDECDGITETLYDKTFTDNQKNSDSFLIDTLTLSDGIHHIKVEVIDNAGNQVDINSAVQVIGVDKKAPVGEISVQESDSIDIDNQKWFDKDKIITFCVDTEADVSGIESITLWINGEEKTFSKDKIQSNENGYRVTADTANITYNSEKKYVVTGEVTDIAGNTFELSAYTAYIDCDPPLINKLSVEKESSALDKILNVLSFGAFSNDSLTFKAYVFDADYDSGIDYVTIMYDGLESPENMDFESIDGKYFIYSHKITVDTKTFQSNIVVTAYDKYGKISSYCPNIENTDQNGESGSIFAMIETDAPVVSISKPEGDGISRTDSQTWFKSNKDIIISVYDKDSGIRNIDITVNGINVSADKNGVYIPEISMTESAKERDNEIHIYTFDTNYFTRIAGEPEDGKYTIIVEATDNSGNVNSQESFTYYIDKISPAAQSFEFVPETSDNISETTEYIEYLEYGFYFKKDFIANIHVADSEPSSGLNKIEYRLVSYDNGEMKEEKTGESVISDGIASIEIPASFKGQVFVKACDGVGNYSDEKTPKAFVADDIPPTINITGIGNSRYSDINGNKLFTDNIAVTVMITDTKSGIKEIGYYQTSEKNGFDRRAVSVDETNITLDSEIGDGWIVTQMDANLVTEITKTFIFDEDNNDVTLTFDAIDNSCNINKAVHSETFTVDKTAPIINVEISNGINDTIYYNAQNKAVMTINITERNFDASLIQATIANAYNGNVPNISFDNISETEHRAVVTFGEGDYTFDIRGTDLGGHSAEVNLDYGKTSRFYVDETAPVIEENFSVFKNADTDNYLNTEKTAVIKITEHNFDPSLTGLKILKKEAGTEHNESQFTDVTYTMVNMYDWVDNSDTHVLSIKFDNDAVYRIEISPSDPSGNFSEYRSSEIFEIDTTLPVVSSKNGSFVDDTNALEFLDIYSYDRKDEEAPTVGFSDVNFDYIKYVLTVYAPEYSNGRELSEVKPISVYLDSDKNQLGICEDDMFTLPNFTKDGVYALELIALDKAGNESVLNLNTYMRMIDSDVLAYISNSNAAKETGWYSFQYENGEPISKRPDNFSDIEIVVLAKNNSDIDIVLRDYNGDEENTELQAEINDSIYGVSIYSYTLKSDYFKDNFQEDTDVELYLSVKSGNKRIDLGKMHIDNIPPSCTLPDDLKSWNWYFGNDSRTVIITNISEQLDETKCNVYDNGKEIDFIYSKTDRSLSFTLDAGWHNVGIKLEDVAGNSYSIQEVDNIHIGYFWLWVVIISSVIIIGIIILIIYIVRKKRYS